MLGYRTKSSKASPWRTSISGSETESNKGRMILQPQLKYQKVYFNFLLCLPRQMDQIKWCCNDNTVQIVRFGLYTIDNSNFCKVGWLQGVKVGTLGRQNERNSSYVRLAHTSTFGLCFISVCLMKSNCYSLIYSSLIQML